MHAKKPYISHVAGHSDDASITGAFAAHFSDSNPVTSRSLVSLCDVFCADVSQNGKVFKWMFSTEEVDKVINTLKFGRAVGIDGISSEHLRYSHPAIVFHLKTLFNLMLMHGYVPDKFGSGIIVPLLKDRLVMSVVLTITELSLLVVSCQRFLS